MDAFKKHYGKIPQAYDAVHALAYAIKKAGSTAPPKMAKALCSAQGLEGMAGPVHFDGRGNRLGTNIAIKMIKDGRFEYLPSEEGHPSGASK